MLIIHTHSLLEEGQFGRVLRLAFIVALGAHLRAFSGVFVEQDLTWIKSPTCYPLSKGFDWFGSYLCLTVNVFFSKGTKVISLKVALYIYKSLFITWYV